MLSVLAKANARASERNRTRWRNDPDGMRRIAIKNARAGTLALKGSKFSATRSARASIGQRGKKMGGCMMAGPSHPFAKAYALVDSRGQIHRGDNIIDFVRTHPEMFSVDDLVWKRGHCRASKGLSTLRPTNEHPKLRWKGWTWVWETVDD